MPITVDWFTRLTGDRSLSLATQVLLDSPVFPQSDYYTPFTYCTTLSFRFSLSGPAVTAPDGASGSNVFAFSLFDNASPNPQPVLMPIPLPADDPGAFAFTAELDNTGNIALHTYSTAVSVSPVTSPPPSVPEPGTAVGAVMALSLFFAARLRHWTASRM